MRTLTTRLQVLAVLVAFIATTRSSAIPQTDEHKSRVIDRPLSDAQHFEEDDGDDDFEEHHNEDYDHEAFLGKDEVKSFDQLTPEESKAKLQQIYVKIDSNGDGQVSEEELTAWIKHVQSRYIRTDTDRQWKDNLGDDSNETLLPWDTYAQKTYGRTEEGESENEAEEAYNYRDMMRRDRRRWARADVDQDGKLNKQEFSDFLHPEEVEHMKGIVIDETLEDIDKDKDDQISIEEYIGDMWPNPSGEEEEPEWVRTEREQFQTFRDKDKDGFMNRGEVADWIIPEDYDHAIAEAKHLIFESDADKDGQLTQDEVLNKYDLFVGSQATDFGDALTKHDEF